MGIIRAKFKNIIINPLFYLISFTIINFILMFNAANLAPPDFYKYYFAGKKLFEGSLKLRFIPPLFPFLQVLFGKIINLFVLHSDPYIIGSKLISFVSGIGIIVYTYKLLKEFIGKLAYLGTLFIIISPLFLNFLVFPTTDFLYLFFVLLSFYLLLKEKPGVSFLSVLFSALTRFEGVLLFFSYIINFINMKKKHFLKYIISLIIISPGIYFFYLKFANRLINKIIFIIKSKSFLYFFIHPNHLFYIVYSGVLDFIPFKTPPFIRWSIAYFLILVFILGLFFLAKKNIRFFFAILIYEFVFAISKGYIFTVHKFYISFSHHIRRFLSFIFIFYIVSIIGFYYLFKIIKEKLGNRTIYFRIIIYVFIIYLLLVRFIITLNTFFISFMFILPVLYLYVKERNYKRFEKIIFIILFFMFFTNIYLKSFVKSYRYNASAPNKGAYAIAKWINKAHLKPNDKIAVFSTLHIVRYYLKRKAGITTFIPKKKNIYSDENRLILYFKRKIKKHKIKYIAFDGYINPIDRPGEVALKKMLFKESHRENFLKVKKFLSYKHHYAATILEYGMDNINK